MAHSEASEAVTSTSLMWGRQAGKEAEEEREQVAEEGEGEGREGVVVGGRFKASRKNIFY